MKDLTGGAELSQCPWLALSDPFVARVRAAMPFFESGQLGFGVPNPSHRLVDGISHFYTVSNRVYARQMEIDRAERQRAPNALPMRGGKRG